MPQDGGAQAPVAADKDAQGFIQNRSNSFEDPLGFLKRMASQKDKRQSNIESLKEEDEEAAEKAAKPRPAASHPAAQHQDRAAQQKK